MSTPFGKNIKLYIDGCAHDEKITMLLSGIPSGIEINESELKEFLGRRSPSFFWETPRKEADIPVFESGIKDGFTDGGDIRAYIKNENVNSTVYSDVNRFPRPSHADYPAVIKYGENVDLRGGGHFSGRLTVLTCVAGFTAKKFIEQKGISVFSHIYSVKDIYDSPFDCTNPVFEKRENAVLGVISKEAEQKMLSALKEAKEQGNSLGGIIECAVTGLKAGLGEHMFSSVEATISDAVFSVPAVKGIEFGAGFKGTALSGKEYNDAFYYDRDEVKTYTNNCGGILGGMTDGMPIIFRAAMKPTPSIATEQNTVDLKEKKNAEITVRGRHDCCIVPRALPVIESAAALGVADLILGEEEKTLSCLRREIDITDMQIVSLLNRRNELSREVAEVKKNCGKAVLDKEREQTLIKRIKSLAGDENSDFAEEIYSVILRNSKEIQKRITENE